MAARRQYLQFSFLIDKRYIFAGLAKEREQAADGDDVIRCDGRADALFCSTR
jgi:hypothetical protein